MRIFMRVGFGTAAIDCSHPEQAELILRQYAPMIVPTPGDSPPDLEIRWCTGDNVEVTMGSEFRLVKRMSALEEIEWRIIQLLLEGASRVGASVLHAACVVYAGHPIVFLGRSGAGKSSLTRAALLRGASYVTDDLLAINGRRMVGLARSVRFSDMPASGELPEWLRSAEFLPRRRLDERRVPVFPNCGLALEEVELGQKAVTVVHLERGTHGIRELSSAERLVHLHQATLANTRTYDGSLGLGPTLALEWGAPDRGFSEIESRYFTGVASS